MTSLLGSIQSYYPTTLDILVYFCIEKRSFIREKKEKTYINGGQEVLNQIETE